MKKTGLGGETPFPISTKPNMFTPLSNEELLTRRGESALWYRLSPCPCPSGDKTPDCPFCFEGQIRTFQEDLEIREEVSWKVSGSSIWTRYSPISEIEEAILVTRGERRPLHIKDIQSEYFNVEENLKYWNIVELKYKVSMLEETVIEAIGDNDFTLFPKLPDGVIVDVLETYKIEVDGRSTRVKHTAFSLNSITFANRTNGLYRIRIRYFSPIKIAYRTFNVDNRKAFEKSQIHFQDGELMGVIGSGYRLGQGDIFTLLKSTLRHSDFVQPTNKEIDRLSYSPIAYIDSVISKGPNGLIEHKKGLEYVQFGDSKIRWIDDKPRNGYTVIYDYFQTFRVTGFIEAGSGEDRPKPRVFKMKPVPSFNARE
ncbi:hypothetical protein [Leptospira licerasiae]|uniref:Uncharacterized protein n=1 Tax=Leptospira licerasiae str. MMD4847 TaxID=1049971 RepID=A0ABN0H9P3_9LEPT|nr:hypothetical protein [Leptospira licerasiae]EIE01416.1 hypothetical protein LEP1GSC185_3916 [Leptospira licerasiae serovar Varillal str. VAR 010]EJZ42297.1 hypothetical protein LEP1GSC178_0082 [Leptospira licerasiae str. MMD4847]